MPPGLLPPDFLTLKPKINMSSIVTATRNKNLKFVDNLNEYKVHHDDTDIRGFDVKTTDGLTIGEVEGLLADVPARLVRYVEVEVNDDLIGGYTGSVYSAEDRHVLLPTGLIRVNANDRSVTVYGISMEQMFGYPRYNRARGYTTSYELDTNNYLSDFHEYGSSYQRDIYDTDKYRSADSFDDSFYRSQFYTGR